MELKETGSAQEDYGQEDRSAGVERSAAGGERAHSKYMDPERAEIQNWRILAEFTLVGDRGGEEFARRGGTELVKAVRELRLPASRLAQLKNAVARAAQSAVAHGSQDQAGRPVSLRVLTLQGQLPPVEIEISHSVETQAKSSPRAAHAWGYFLIEKMTEPGEGIPQPIIELYLYPEGKPEPRPE